MTTGQSSKSEPKFLEDANKDDNFWRVGKPKVGDEKRVVRKMMGDGFRGGPGKSPVLELERFDLEDGSWC